jgi:hypothetical protein
MIVSATLDRLCYNVSMNTDRKNKYEEAAQVLRSESGVVVRKVRSSSTGRAHRDGTISAPAPRGPVSFGVFAHEVGHQVLGHNSNGRAPRWIEEVEAWEYALNQLERFQLNGYERVYAHAAEALAINFGRALRRGVKPATIAECFPGWWKDSGWQAQIDRGWHR